MSYDNTQQAAIYNFNAGPSILPKTVFEQAAAAVLNFNNTGLSILELGHRTPEFTAVMEEARSLVKELMLLDDDHEVLFLHGGASTQFMQVPMNLLDAKDTAAYTDTGIWGYKAIKEAKLFGKVEVVCSSREKVYNYIPKDFKVDEKDRIVTLTEDGITKVEKILNLENIYNQGPELVHHLEQAIKANILLGEEAEK